MVSRSKSTLLPQGGSGKCMPCNSSQNRLHLRSLPRSHLGDNSPALDHTPGPGQFKFRDSSQYLWRPDRSGLSQLSSWEASFASNLRYRSGKVLAIRCCQSTSSWDQVATFQSPACPTQWAWVSATSTLPPFHRHQGCPWYRFWARRGSRIPWCCTSSYRP